MAGVAELRRRVLAQASAHDRRHGGARQHRRESVLMRGVPAAVRPLKGSVRSEKTSVATSLRTSPGATDHAPMNPGPTATATIELALGVEAPKGVLTDGDGRARRFNGWIELAAAIEDWRTASRRSGPIQEEFE
jgi:hypothetical protein